MRHSVLLLIALLPMLLTIRLANRMRLSSRFKAKGESKAQIDNEDDDSRKV